MAAAGVVLPACPKEAATAPADRAVAGPSRDSRNRPLSEPSRALARRGREAPELGPLGLAAGWDRRTRMSKGENRDGRDVVLAVKYHRLRLQEPRRSGLEIKPGRPLTERRRVILIPPSA